MGTRIVAALIVTLLLAGNVPAQTARGEAPPDLLGADKDKKDIHVSDYRGKVVVLTFWAGWCTYCLKELPVLENLQRKAGIDRVVVVAINTDKKPADYLAMQRKMKDFRLTMTADLPDGSIARQYGVKGYPHMVMVDKAGLVAYTRRGYSEKTLGSLVNQINELMEE
jgi:thiol-disulfide isomerase/thioredoxin